MQMFADLGISTAPRAQQLLLQEPVERDAPAAPDAARERQPQGLRSLAKGA
jgi:hypothetical protein